MGNKVIVRKNGTEEVFEDLLGHKVGDGAVQLLFMTGGSRVIFNPDDIDITLDDESSKDFSEKLSMQIKVAEEAEKAAEAANDGPKNVVVPTSH